MRGVCFVHVLFHHVAKRPNGRLAQVLGTPVKFPSDSRAIAIPWHRSSSSQKALWCRGALRVGGVRWAVEVFLGLSLKLLFCNPFLTSPKPDLLQLSLPQPGHQHLLHCALRLGSFGTSWITCTSLIPWATSCSPKTAPFKHTPKRVQCLNKKAHPRGDDQHLGYNTGVYEGDSHESAQQETLLVALMILGSTTMRMYLGASCMICFVLVYPSWFPFDQHEVVQTKDMPKVCQVGLVYLGCYPLPRVPPNARRNLRMRRRHSWRQAACPRHPGRVAKPALPHCSWHGSNSLAGAHYGLVLKLQRYTS